MFAVELFACKALGHGKEINLKASSHFDAFLFVKAVFK